MLLSSLFCFLGGCGFNLSSAQDSIDTLSQSIKNIAPANIANANWYKNGMRVSFDRSNGNTWTFKQSEFGASCDCHNDVYYSEYSDTLKLKSNDTAAYNVFSKTEIPIVDSFFKVDSQPSLGSMFPLPTMSQTTFPIFIDDSGNGVLMYSGNEGFRVYYQPYGLVYSKRHSSCGQFCGYSYTTVLTRYNNMDFDYRSAISRAKGLYNKWIAYLQAEKFVVKIQDSSKISEVLLNDKKIWTKGDSLLIQCSQPAQNEGVNIGISSANSHQTYWLSADSPIDSVIVISPTEGFTTKYRKINHVAF